MDGTPSTTNIRSGLTLVVGLGNPLLGDDGVGWRVAEQVEHQVEGAKFAVEVDYLAVGGLHLMERLVGYDRAILIDAVTTGREPAGSLSCFALTDLPDVAGGHLSSAHDTTLQTALRLGRALGVKLPDELVVVGVEADNSFDFAEELTPPVAAAVPRAVQMVIDLLSRCFREE